MAMVVPIFVLLAAWMAAFAADLGDLLRQLAMLAAVLAERRIFRDVAFAGGVSALFRSVHAPSMCLGNGRSLYKTALGETPAKLVTQRLK
jgi:hypothetical protein